jgi:membrane associated rhomboid family serine protease
MSISLTKKRKEDLTPPPPKPVVTILLILVAWFLPFFISMAKGQKAIWTTTYGFSASRFFELSGNGDFSGLISLIILANFAQISFWVYLFNAFYIWSFGSVVERIMGNARFMVFVLLGIFASWSILAYDAISTQPEMAFIGPTTFTLVLLGSYLLFLPRKPFKPTDWVKPSWKIFREEETVNMTERYWVSPWVNIFSFLVYTIIVQFALNITRQGLEESIPVSWIGDAYQFLLGKGDGPISIIRPIAALEIIVFGFLASAFIMILTSIKPKALRAGGELQWATVQHYRQLRALDLTHEQAIEGAAKFVAVPYDIAKDWVTKGADDKNEEDQGKSKR